MASGSGLPFSAARQQARGEGAIAMRPLSPIAPAECTAAALAAHDAAFERVFAAIQAACRSSRLWPLQVSGAVTAALEFAAAEPAAARLLTVEAVSQDAAVARRVLQSSDRLAQMLSSGRHLSPAAAQLPALTEKALIGAGFAIVSARLQRDETLQLAELRPQLVELLLGPYLGVELAARVARGALAPPPSPSPRAGATSLPPAKRRVSAAVPTA